MVAANSLALEAQLEERPLAKKQEALLDNDACKEGEKTGESSVAKAKGQDKPDEKSAQVKKALLKNDDTELQRVNKVRVASLVPPRPSKKNFSVGTRRNPYTVLQRT